VGNSISRQRSVLVSTFVCRAAHLDNRKGPEMHCNHSVLCVDLNPGVCDAFVDRSRDLARMEAHGAVV